MLDRVVSGVRASESRLRDAGFAIEVVPSRDPEAPNTGYVDLFSEDRAARVTMFRDGLCDFEVIGVADGERVAWEHVEFTDPADVGAVVAAFLDRLTSQGGT